jgi:hypothetical protein
MAFTADLYYSLLLRRAGISANLLSEQSELLDQDFDEQTVQGVEVANGAVDQAISLGGVTTASLLLLISDQAVSVKVNGAAAGIACRTLLLTGAAATSLSVSNSSGATANVRVYLLGS